MTIHIRLTLYEKRARYTHIDIVEDDLYMKTKASVIMTITYKLSCFTKSVDCSVTTEFPIFKAFSR